MVRFSPNRGLRDHPDLADCVESAAEISTRRRPKQQTPHVHADKTAADRSVHKSPASPIATKHAPAGPLSPLYHSKSRYPVQKRRVERSLDEVQIEVSGRRVPTSQSVPQAAPKHVSVPEREGLRLARHSRQPLDCDDGETLVVRHFSDQHRLPPVLRNGACIWRCTNVAPPRGKSRVRSTFSVSTFSSRCSVSISK